MRYELPRKNIQKKDEIVESSIASFWNLKNEWQWNIYHLLKNINSISIKSYKNKENCEVIEKDLFTFLMLSLYYEMPYQMGTLYIIQNNTEIRNKFETDKNNLISKYIYDILILLFKNDRYKIFNIMNNLEITDIKKYVKYDQKEVIIKFYEISLNIHNLCAFNYKYTLNNENIEYYNKAYKNGKCIALPIVYPYIKFCTDTNITVKRFDDFFTRCMIDNEIY